MPVITISRRFEWDAAHRIPGHEGACKAIHGHRYVAEVEVSGPQMDALGRIVDFGVLKTVVGAWIDGNFDHTAVFSRADPDVKPIAELNAAIGGGSGGRAGADHSGPAGPPRHHAGSHQALGNPQLLGPVAAQLDPSRR